MSICHLAGGASGRQTGHVIDNARRQGSVPRWQPRRRGPVTTGPGAPGPAPGCLPARQAGEEVTLDDITDAGPSPKDGRARKTRYIRSPRPEVRYVFPPAPCPPADHRDRGAARTVASHPEQGWSLLCNGVIVFDDMGEILPGGRVIPPHRPARVQLPAAA
jgi:Family of unknown function (DUF5999)